MDNFRDMEIFGNPCESEHDHEPLSLAGFVVSADNILRDSDTCGVVVMYFPPCKCEEPIFDAYGLCKICYGLRVK